MNPFGLFIFTFIGSILSEAAMIGASGFSKEPNRYVCTLAAAFWVAFTTATMILAWKMGHP